MKKTVAELSFRTQNDKSIFDNKLRQNRSQNIIMQIEKNKLLIYRQNQMCYSKLTTGLSVEESLSIKISRSMVSKKTAKKVFGVMPSIFKRA